MKAVEKIILEIDNELQTLEGLNGKEIFGRKVGLAFAKRVAIEAKEMEKEQSLKVPPYNLDDLANKANGYLYFDSKKEHKALAFDDGYKVGFKKALELLTFKSE